MQLKGFNALVCKCKQTKANLIFINLLGRIPTIIIVDELPTVLLKLLQVTVVVVEGLETSVLRETVAETPLVSLDMVMVV